MIHFLTPNESVQTDFLREEIVLLLNDQYLRLNLGHFPLDFSGTCPPDLLSFKD